MTVLIFRSREASLRDGVSHRAPSGGWEGRQEEAARGRNDLGQRGTDTEPGSALAGANVIMTRMGDPQAKGLLRQR